MSQQCIAWQAAQRPSVERYQVELLCRYKRTQGPIPVARHNRVALRTWGKRLFRGRQTLRSLHYVIDAARTSDSSDIPFLHADNPLIYLYNSG